MIILKLLYGHGRITDTLAYARQIYQLFCTLLYFVFEFSIFSQPKDNINHNTINGYLYIFIILTIVNIANVLFITDVVSRFPYKLFIILYCFHKWENIFY